MGIIHWANTLASIVTHYQDNRTIQASRELLYHVRNPRYKEVGQKTKILASIVTSYKDSGTGKWVMKTIDGDIVQAGTIWFKAGYCPRGLGGKQVPKNYEEPHAEQEQTTGHNPTGAPSTSADSTGSAG